MQLLRLLISGAALLGAITAFAADRQIHVRGEISAVSATEFTVTDRKGAKATIKLPETAAVLDVSRTTVGAIKENSYLGIAAAPAPQGKVRALGVMVFPEAARGLYEGHFPWDTGKRNTMTNATVAKVSKKTSATELEMRFGEKTQRVVLDKATVYGQFVPGQREQIVLGAKVMVIADQGADGVNNANTVMVGRDGFLPPI
ncbi:hypothetical protein [Acidovorax sp.]|uniref:hypothetical protein n=1 Tax=Acidovorax sp. TaxID=1872122 RepID=UPI00261EAB1D|nr:hypothetical protein [Acidovorax sp.]